MLYCLFSPNSIRSFLVALLLPQPQNDPVGAPGPASAGEGGIIPGVLRPVRLQSTRIQGWMSV